MVWAISASTWWCRRSSSRMRFTRYRVTGDGASRAKRSYLRRSSPSSFPWRVIHATMSCSPALAPAVRRPCSDDSNDVAIPDSVRAGPGDSPGSKVPGARVVDQSWGHRRRPRTRRQAGHAAHAPPRPVGRGIRLGR